MRFWRTHDLSSTQPARVISAKEASASDDVLSLLEPIGIECLGSDPIMLLVGSSESRRRLRGIECIVWSGELPSGSLRRIATGVYVSSPEMCFLQYCAGHSVQRSIQYGMELCGSYAVGQDGKGAEYNRERLTTPAKLASFIEKCEGNRGVRTARRSLEHILGGSASPLETIVVMLMCMPVRYGGYGLPAPNLNMKLAMSEQASAIAGKHYFKCDLFWPERNVALEYNSTEFHAEVEAMNSDYQRSNVLGYMNVTVLLITWDMVRDPDRFESVCTMLSKHLDYRIKMRIDRREFISRRADLRGEIMRPLAI